MNIEMIRRCSYVALVIPISSCYSIKISYQHIVSNIEFPFIVKKRSIYIHLDYVGFLTLYQLLLFLFTYSFSLFDYVV